MVIDVNLGRHDLLKVIRTELSCYMQFTFMSEIFVCFCGLN